MIDQHEENSERITDLPPISTSVFLMSYMTLNLIQLLNPSGICMYVLMHVIAGVCYSLLYYYLFSISKAALLLRTCVCDIDVVVASTSLHD